MRLINADALLDAVMGIHWYHVNDKGHLVSGSTSEYESWIKYEDAISAINKALTITHVKHARWLPHKPGDVHACSSCGFGVLPSRWFKNGIGIGPIISHNKFRYCPNCGAMMVNAKMDGVPHDDSGQ